MNVDTLSVKGDIDLNSLRPRNAIILLNRPGGVGAALTSQGPGRSPQWGPVRGISSGTLPTVAFNSGVAAQNTFGRDVNVVVPVTFTPTAGATATCVVALSADDSTFTTLVTMTVPLGTALDSFILPATFLFPSLWWGKLTVTNGSIGTGHYY